MVTMKKSKRGDKRTEAQIEAQVHNWTLFQMKGMLAAIATIRANDVLSKKVVDAIEEALQNAVNDLQPKGEKK